MRSIIERVENAEIVERRSNYACLCKLNTMSEAEVRANAIKLEKLYPIDLTNGLQQKCLGLKQYLTTHANKIS